MPGSMSQPHVPGDSTLSARPPDVLYVWYVYAKQYQKYSKSGDRILLLLCYSRSAGNKTGFCCYF